jgi:hypothetical protein
VDKVVMKNLAHKFVSHKNKVHGLDEWVIMFCDNLSAHLDEEVREIFGENKVFLCYFPPNMTNFIQPIDAGLGRSVRNKIANLLDEWLMIEQNLERWEGKMTASERRIVTTHFISNAIKYVMSSDMEKMRLRAFEKTGCLITWIPMDDHDSKIRPQGMPEGLLKVSNARKITLVDDSLPEPMDTENATLLEESKIIEEEEEDG